MIELLLTLVEDAFFSAIPAVGFAMLFAVPPRLLVFCAIGGALGHASRSYMMHLGFGIEIASFLAAALIGLVGVYWSRKYLVPRPVFTVAAMIPMIPGTYAFKTIIGVFALHTGGYSIEVMSSIAENGLITLFVLMALSFGLAIPSVVLYRFRPIV